MRLLDSNARFLMRVVITIRYDPAPPKYATLARAVLGGYAGAHVARRFGARQLRIGLTVFNVAVTRLVFARVR